MTSTPELKQGRLRYAAGQDMSQPVVAATAARRAGMAGLVFAVCYAVFEVVFLFARGAQVKALLPFFFTNAAVGIGMGLGMYGASRKWRENPDLVLKLGIVFYLVSSLLIGVAETLIPFGPNEMVHGSSSVALWIAAYSLLAPMPMRWALPASLGAALMAPAGIWLNHVRHGNPFPDVGVWAIWTASPVIMAMVATWLAQWVYQLGAELDAEKAMGSYQLIEPVGQGGMGQVWRAKHRSLAREAAVKLIHQHATSSLLHRKRFEREAKAVARLESPHTVAIYDFGTTPAGELYYAMELIRGLNLEELVKRFGPQPAARVRHIWMGVLRSLDEAHAVGLTHRDIKPSNILLARVAREHDFVKVVDFGLAKVEATEGQTQLTMETSTVGTPAYMAPELARGEEDQVDGRADLYAMGCVAYYLLTGKTVFEAPTGMALLVKHLQEPVVPPSERVEIPVPAELERMVMWCLEKKAENRPQSAGELLGALERVEIGEWEAGARKRWWETHLPSLA